MAVKTSLQTGNIGLALTAYHNGDDVQLFWNTRVDGQLFAPVPGCIGFMVQRQRQQPGGGWAPIEILRNRVGFSDKPNGGDGQAPGYPTKPSNIWPFQCFEWTDHGANSGQTVRYQVTAMRLPDGGTPGTTELEPIAGSGWTEPIDVSADCGEGSCAFFNRGFVMSQYVARLARKNGWQAKDIKAHIMELQEPLRRFLSGELRLALLRLLDEVIDDPQLSLYAALYELSDDELLSRLKLLRSRAHVVLANGSDRQGDGNADARTALKAEKVDVHDRLLKNKGLGHNKFAVVTRAEERVPLKAWTGSTNWSATGLCTQVNNGILIQDPQIAACYLAQWDRLAAARSSFPDSLVSANAQSPYVNGGVDVWFTRVRNHSTKNKDFGRDLQALVDLVNGAKEMILYVMFQPGPEPLSSILLRASQLYVRGVVSTVTSQAKEQFQLNGVDTDSKEYKTALVQPEGIGEDFSAWVKEVTRAEFLFPYRHPGIGYAITHAKIIVVDPLRDDCKVVTGSHNFSGAASEENDENLLVVHGNKALAEAYAVACLATYSNYRWRAYVKDQVTQGKKVWDHLSDKPTWQTDYLTAARKQHLTGWCQ